MTARGFAALAAGPARRVRSWWATGWLRTWDDLAWDPQPMRRGRRYARAGHVGPVTVSVGRVSAVVHDGDPDRAYRAVVRVAVLSDADWARVVGAVADRAGHLAALLARQLPDALGDDAGVPLSPGPGDLTPDCECPDWEHPCRHVAALATQVGWLLDTDPFLLLLMRGRDEVALLAAVHAHTADAGRSGAAVRAVDAGSVTVGRSAGTGPAGAATPSAGDDPRQVFATPPAALPVPAGAVDGQVTLPLVAPADGVDPQRLRDLVAVGAARAAALLAEFGGRDDPRAATMTGSVRAIEGEPIHVPDDAGPR
ncbi:SWIM zinc finger family protein [Micromonospora cathayae]|uniref:SWIM zinc finger family protein n=1 Tax=Micromonospora cathayae TaxID=3028804 RepID=A0ABY7ZJR8_9ACTN|nr:SWIM zinc finger family protein [Micromonospora sp. HUAS 3]WDZ83160.1 SWIM zinc finger family protein [Micromonospora sp. HUAS 3]